MKSVLLFTSNRDLSCTCIVSFVCTVTLTPCICRVWVFHYQSNTVTLFDKGQENIDLPYDHFAIKLLKSQFRELIHRNKRKKTTEQSMVCQNLWLWENLIPYHQEKEIYRHYTLYVKVQNHFYWKHLLYCMPNTEPSYREGTKTLAKLFKTKLFQKKSSGMNRMKKNHFHVHVGLRPKRNLK